MRKKILSYCLIEPRFFAAALLWLAAVAPARAIMNGVDQDILPVTSIFNSSVTIMGEGGIFVAYGVSAATAAFTAQNASVPGVTISSGVIVSTGNVGIGTANPGEVLEVNGNLKIGSATTGIIRATKELVLRQDGDTYGPSILRLRNRNAENGVIFETTDPTTTLVDYIFKTSANQRNFRYEARAAMSRAGNPSFHIGGLSADNPTLAVGDAYAAVANKLAVGSYTSPTAVLQLAAGTAAAGTAPLKLTSGTNLTATEGGAIEFAGGHLYFTAADAGTRYQLDQQAPLTITAIGAAPNANGMTLTGQQLNLQPADASNGGVVTTGAQTFAGVKTFSSQLINSNAAAAALNLTGNGAGITFTGTGPNQVITAAGVDLALMPGAGGNVGIGVTVPTARLHLPAGTAAANTAPLMFTSGIDLAAPEAGAMEFDGANLEFSTSATGIRTVVNRGQLIGVQTITAGTTYTPTAGTGRIIVELWGGGGGGGGCNNAAGCAGGGGGAGGYARYTFTGVVNANYTVAIGGGGAGNSGAAGSAGTNTTFTNGATVVTAYGGAGGAYTAGSNGVKFMAGGAGGAVSANGTVNGAGMPGSYGQTNSNTIVNSGFGGSTSLGGGGVGRASTTGAGNAAVANTGSGGGGAATIATGSAYAGGAGAAGRIIVQEFY